MNVRVSCVGPDYRLREAQFVTLSQSQIAERPRKLELEGATA